MAADLEAPDVWASFNMQANITTSDRGYLLAVSNRIVPRLDDLTLIEEQAFWNFALGHAKRAVNEPDFFPAGDFGYQLKPAECVFVAVNDGWQAGQSVPHVHGHVIGLEDARDTNIQSRILGDSIVFNNGSACEPLTSESLIVSDRFAAEARDVRNNLRSQFSKSADPGDCGFWIYSDPPVKRDGSIQMRIELWSTDRPAWVALSGLVRYWTGFSTAPVLAHPSLIKNKVFERAPAL